MASDGDGERPGDRDPDRDRATDADRDESGLRFSLPAFRLPPMFPDDFRIVLPGRDDDRRVGVGARRLVVATLVLDSLDAAVAVAGPAGLADWIRAAVGTVVALFLVGPVGGVYLWEAGAVAGGLTGATVVPSLTLLVVLRTLR